MKRIFCKNRTAIPTIKEIHSFTKETHLVLDFPKEELEKSIQEVVESLKGKLPDYSIFIGYRQDSLSISIIPVINEAQIITQLNEIKKALGDYITLSNLLLENVTDEISWKDWELTYEHSPHNRYENSKTKQITETCDYKMLKIKNIDIYFLGVFIQTSADYPNLNKILLSTFHDTARILDYLEQINYNPF